MILMFLGYRNMFKKKSADNIKYLQNKRSFNLSIISGEIKEIHKYAKLLARNQHLSTKYAEEMLRKTTELSKTKEGLEPTIKVIKEIIHNLKYGLGWPEL